MEVFEKEHHPNQALRNFERDGAFWLWVSIGSVFVTYGLLKYFGLNPNGNRLEREKKTKYEVEKSE
ncbi:MAG TPA: hypothetical protein H9667_01445 [Firmicutes bacterium]|nr:hypothetical protein [Bacillales bacterium]HJA40182.1 hypothetical protein [Bacillota bacterium]